MCSSASGRLTRKSSPFSPLSSKPNKQTLLHRDMMVHYDKINRAKAVIDNKPPASMTNHIKAKDNIRKREKAKQSHHSSRPSSRASNMDALNETWAAVQSGRWSQLAHSLPGQSGVDISTYSLDDTMSHLMLNSSANNQYLSETIEEFSSNDSFLDSDYIKTVLNNSHSHAVAGYPRRTNSRSESASLMNERLVYSYKEGPRVYERLASGSSNYDLMLDPKFKKIKEREERRKEEEKYLKFVEDITNDIIARNIASDRVLTKVFEYHVVKNKRLLDEDRMRILIEELKTDLSIEDYDASDEDKT